MTKERVTPVVGQNCSNVCRRACGVAVKGKRCSCGCDAAMSASMPAAVEGSATRSDVMG
jgi:hypothetical protein